MKTPQLINHFIQHHQLNTNLSFVDFLEMHYFGHDLNDNDDEEDMKLPFKKVDGHHLISVAVPTEKFILNKAKCFDLFSGKTVDYHHPVCCPKFGSLFRPPILLG